MIKRPNRSLKKDVKSVIGVGKQIIRGAKKLKADYHKAYDESQNTPSKNKKRENLKKYGHNYY